MRSSLSPGRAVEHDVVSHAHRSARADVGSERNAARDGDDPSRRSTVADHSIRG
jgi:hypothetical protein